MIKSLAAATTAAVLLTAAPAVAMAPLVVHIKTHFANPAKVTESAYSKPRKTITIENTIRCGGSVHHGHFNQPSGALHTLTLPAHHEGNCTIRLTASMSGYGHLHARLAEHS